MSYVEHGPRIFLAGRPNTGIPLTYGDYVLPRKRLEGRLKLHDSCSDIRAWSPNSLENSRYFRELSEHDPPLGKIIPFNVLVDNIIRLNSRTQTELQVAKKELKKYKSLKLTSTQEEQLETPDHSQQSLQKGDCTKDSSLLLQDALLHISKSVNTINSNSCFPLHISPEQHFQNNKNDGVIVPAQSAQLYSYVLHTDPSSNKYTLLSSFMSPRKLPPTTANCNEKATSWIEYIDVALQVQQETHDVGVQFDGQDDKCFNKVITVSAMSQTSFMYKSSEGNSDVDLDKSSLQTINHDGQSSECDASCSESIQDTITLLDSDSDIDTESDFDIRSNIHKGDIIEKDSEIIVLKNELCVRDADLKELRDINTNLEILLREKESCISIQQKDLKTLHETLMKLGHQRNCEIEDLQEKLYCCNQLIAQLNQELQTKCESYDSQSQKIEKLELYIDKVKMLQTEKDSLLMKLQNMEQVAKKAESYNLVVEQLKNMLHEKTDLEKQVEEQSCMLADQGAEIKRLLTLIEQTSVTYDEQAYGDEKIEPAKDDINKDSKKKENEIEDVQEQQLLSNRDIKNEMYQSNYAMYGPLNLLENNSLRIRNQNETTKLLEEIEIRDSEIRNLKQTINCLAQENAHLRTLLKSEIEGYQDKLTLMKRNYDSSLNALCKRHKESVETLQKRFEDIIKDERIFESENWLQTLSMNELTELYNRISVIIDSNRNLIHRKDENKHFYENDFRNELYTDINKTCNKMQISPKNICEMDLENQWQFTILRQTEYPVLQMQDSKFNLRQDFGCSKDEKRPSKLEKPYEKEKEIERDNTFDQQRWNFINQCSAYHKLSNTYEYPKNVSRD
ncbi:uncharacterized protein LOC143177344 [Calliopsis andreniformis]|uniref:uncharacterized protein LOC143177344 n=1 Tax=Calliopsis andreniformis TaxID=337506 RepID=UPI003FCE4386